MLERTPLFVFFVSSFIFLSSTSHAQDDSPSLSWARTYLRNTALLKERSLRKDFTSEANQALVGLVCNALTAMRGKDVNNVCATVKGNLSQKSQAKLIKNWQKNFPELPALAELNLLTPPEAYPCTHHQPITFEKLASKALIELMICNEYSDIDDPSDSINPPVVKGLHEWFYGKSLNLDLTPQSEEVLVVLAAQCVFAHKNYPETLRILAYLQTNVGEYGFTYELVQRIFSVEQRGSGNVAIKGL